MRTITMGFFLVILVLAYGAILRKAHAQDIELPVVANEIDRELALALAKITWNEASSYAEPEDLYLIAQVTENHGENNAERLAWLRRHSSCVLTDRAMEAAELRSNCLWTRNLAWSLEEPEGWPQAFEWRVRRRTWALMLRRASQIVVDWRFTRPCDGNPTTWGGRIIDMHQALRRGLVPHRCTDTLGNVGFSLRG
jgi:hypothetical protein